MAFLGVRIFVVAAAVAAAIALPPCLATEFVVGDNKGWALNFDYQAWTQGKEFRVGDKLVFKYKQGAHNVIRVDGATFRNCTPAATAGPLTTGNDVIILATEGRKWYICGVGNHCESGMKLAITVLPGELESPASAPSPATSSASGVAFYKLQAWLIGAFGTLMMMMMV
ncbi:hypothetical protein NMG60_11030380 [Bertholletia excelsa]